MNYHSDEWIMQGLQNHYDQILQYIPKERIIAIILKGSQNYGLDHANSDIDSSCIFIPTKDEIKLYPDWMEKQTIAVNDIETVTLIDIRQFTYGLEKCSLFFLERLYSPYYIIPNEKYKFLWQQYTSLANDLVQSNKIATATSIYFYMNIIRNHITANFLESRKAASEARGYDNKALSYAIRYYLLLQLLETDYPFSYCLNPQLNILALNAKNGVYDSKSVINLEQFLYTDFDRIYHSIQRTQKIDKTKNKEILQTVKFLESTVMNIYFNGGEVR